MSATLALATPEVRELHLLTGLSLTDCWTIVDTIGIDTARELAVRDLLEN